MNMDFGSHIDDMESTPARRLSGEDLAEMFLNKTIWGDFGPDYRFVASIDASGTAEAANNAGTFTTGQVMVDRSRAILSSRWQNHWPATSCQGFALGDKFKFFDFGTGTW